MALHTAKTLSKTVFGSVRDVVEGSRARRLILLVLPIAFAIVLLSRFAYPGRDYLSFFTDDFYYYLKIAMNLVDHGRSTFDGIRDTNGYHPLWLLISAGLFALFGNSTALFVAFVVLILLLGFVSLLHYVAVCGALARDKDVAFATAVYLSTLVITLSRTGMEVSLAMMLSIILVWRLLARSLEDQTWLQAVGTGLLSAALCLSRIDAILLPALYGAVTILFPIRSRGEAVTKSIFVAIGGLPVLAYLAINRLAFGVFLPISGSAKQLKVGFAPSFKGLASVLKPDGYSILFIWPILLLALVFVLLVLTRRIRLPASRRAIVIAVLVHPLVFYGVLAVRSDWRMWAWYLYPVPLIGAVTLPLVLTYGLDRLRGRVPGRLLPIGAALVSAVALAGLVPRNPVSMEIYTTAQRLADFSAAHPGVYAMGDRAGTPGYLMNVPLVQLEGLVEDTRMLDAIRQRRDLNEVLRNWNVDYYVATNEPSGGGCYEASEPSEAGPSSPHMTGSFCQAPVERFRAGALEAQIFKLR